MKYFYYLVLLLILHLILLNSIQFTAWPEMLTYPWLMDRGFQFYGDIMHPYLPLLPYTLSLFYSLFGISIATLKLISISTLLVIDLLLFLIARRSYTGIRVLIPTLFFIPLSLLFEGNGLWFDVASVPFVLGAIYLLYDPRKDRHVIVAGLLLGLAILVKQTNVIYVLAALFLLKDQRTLVIRFLLTVLTPFFVVSLMFFFIGKGQEFMHWGVTYPIFMLSRMPGFPLAPTARQLIVSLLVFSPLLITFRQHTLFTFLTIISLIFAFPRFAYFHLLPASAFLTLSLVGLTKYKPLFMLYSVGVLLVTTRLFMVTTEPVRFFEPDVLTQRVELVQALPSDTPIFFLNVPSQYFVMTPLKVAKPWVDTFPWYFELTHIETEVLKTLENVNYAVVRDSTPGTEYGLGSYQPKVIREYIQTHFEAQTHLSGGAVLYSRRKPSSVYLE